MTYREGHRTGLDALLERLADVGTDDLPAGLFLHSADEVDTIRRLVARPDASDVVYDERVGIPSGRCAGIPIRVDATVPPGVAEFRYPAGEVVRVTLPAPVTDPVRVTLPAPVTDPGAADESGPADGDVVQ